MKYAIKLTIKKTYKEGYRKRINRFAEKKMKARCISSRMPITACLSLNKNVSKKNKKDSLYKGRPNKRNCTTSL